MARKMNEESLTTTIRISKDLRNRLDKVGERSETFEQILDRVLSVFEKKYKRN
ncbi:MAG: hypothetical protein WC595_07065 [Candidatus Nanoarchaeia archaeon]